VIELDRERVRDYFSRPGTVGAWWVPEDGPLRFHYEAELAVVEEQLGFDPAWRVLDVGTGRGRFGLRFARAGCRVLGIDLNPEMLDVARAAAGELGLEARYRAEAGSAEDLSRYESDPFDVVLCMELFDHLPDLARALASMRRVLRPSGRFVFTYVPSESLYGLVGNAYRAWQRRAHPERPLISRTYSLGAVRRALAEAGLVLERFYGVGLLAANAQTRIALAGPLQRAANGIARWEAGRWPYHRRPWLARHGAHVVGIARPAAGGRP